MRKSFVSLAALAMISVLPSVSSAAETVVTGGVVHFTGEVVNAACAVSSDSGDQTVRMGQVRSASFGGEPGKTMNQKQFKIVLVDCDSEVSQNAAVSFIGDAVSDGSALRVGSKTTPGNAATGVGIQILDSANDVIKPNSGTAGAATKIQDGTTVIPLSAQYISTEKVVTPGAADADMVFSIVYN
jgi:type 1 fimbria pilin